MNYTFVTLEVSDETYNEIYELLAKAEYHHTFLENDRLIDMHGISLVKKQRTKQEKELAEFAKDFAKQAVKQIIRQANE